MSNNKNNFVVKNDNQTEYFYLYTDKKISYRISIIKKIFLTKVHLNSNILKNQILQYTMQFV